MTRQQFAEACMPGALELKLLAAPCAWAAFHQLPRSSESIMRWKALSWDVQNFWISTALEVERFHEEGGPHNEE